MKIGILEKYKEPTPEALVESAEHNIKLLEDNDFINKNKAFRVSTGHPSNTTPKPFKHPLNIP